MRPLVLAMGLLLCAPAPASELGRLFTTPAQRQHLEQGIGESGDAAPTARREEGIQVQGILRRKGGAAIIWVNGRAVTRGEEAHGVRLLEVNPRGAVVSRPGQEAPLAVKPGQRIGADGRIIETFGHVAPATTAPGAAP